MSDPDVNAEVPVPPAEPTMEDLVRTITRMSMIIDAQGQALVNLNDNLGKVAKFAGMKVENMRERLDG